MNAGYLATAVARTLSAAAVAMALVLGVSISSTGTWDHSRSDERAAVQIDLAAAHSYGAPAALPQSRATQMRHSAMRWAKTQEGKWYCRAGNGPSCYDCSGLVVAAYKKVGITLPRTTFQLWDGDRKLIRITASKARWGDLVMPGSGHVELYSHKDSKGVRWMFGAHHSGTRIGYAKVYGSSARYFRVVRPS